MLATGIATIPNTGLGIYPNPATSVLNINNAAVNSQLTITDILGNMVYQQPIMNSTQSSIDVSTWNKGVYLLQIKNEKETTVKKVVIE
jgi:hypothetical protein